MGLIFLLSCAVDGELQSINDVDPVDVIEDDAPIEVAQLSSVELLTRASLDFRGVRPSVAEIEQVEADPDSVEDLIDGFLYDERFSSRVRSLYSNVYLTKQDTWYVTAALAGLDSELQPEWADSIGEEPLRILGRIAEEDLSYSDIVTADWTMTNDLLAEAWEIDVSEGEGWREGYYTDGRPAAGVLSTNGMWWRYGTNSANANRGRANAISKIFLCTDYLSKPITFERDVNLLDSNAVNDALQNNPGCVACHYSLDPLAAYLWGFYYFDYYSAIDTATYHPEREYLWEDYSGVGPGYFGEVGFGLSDLGESLARDPRLAECAVEQAVELLLQRDLMLEDQSDINAHREIFIEDGLVLRSLFRSILDSEAYRAAPSDDERYPGAKLIGTDQLASSIEGLTGFRFTYAGYDMLSTDTYGLRTLAGGVDGNFVTQPAKEPMTTMVLVQERLAEGAAWYVTEQDKGSDDPELFVYIGFSETPATDRESMVAQIQHLHLRVFGTRIAEDGPEVEANLALWEELYAVDGDPQSAWAGLLSVLLRDPRFLVY